MSRNPQWITGQPFAAQFWDTTDLRTAALTHAIVAGTAGDPSAKISHEVDAAVYSHDNHDCEVLPAIGEAKGNDTMGPAHLQRLQQGPVTVAAD